MKIKHILFTAAALCCAGTVSALTVKTDQIRNKSVYGISFPSGTSLYMTSMSISSISLQDYISGALNVTEIVIDTLGGTSQVRIYHVAPVNEMETARDALGKAPGQLQNAQSLVDKLEEAKKHIQGKTEIEVPTTDKVYKQYPVTTHSKTIEYAVDSLEELMSLYQALAKDFAGTNTNYKSPTDKQSENLPDRNVLGGKLYEVQSAKELKGK